MTDITIPHFSIGGLYKILCLWNLVQNRWLLQRIGTFEILKKLWYSFYICKIEKSRLHLSICTLGKFV